MEDKYISLEESVAQRVIAKAVSKDTFEKEFSLIKERIEKQENQTTQIIIGVLIASVLIFLTLAVEMWLFTADYHEQNLNAIQKFTEATENLRRENDLLRDELNEQVDELKVFK